MLLSILCGSLSIMADAFNATFFSPCHQMSFIENKLIVTFHVDYSIVLSISYEKQQYKITNYPTEILEIPVSLSSTNIPQWWLAASHNHALGSLYQGKDLRGLPGGEIMFHRDS